MIGYVFVVTIITYIILWAIRLLDQFEGQPIVQTVVSCHGRWSSITKLHFLQKPREGGRTVEPCEAGVRPNPLDEARGLVSVSGVRY